MIYTVKPGDSLYLIAQSFDLNLNELLAVNPDIANPKFIYVGQEIHIPEISLPPSFRFYIVQPGDTLVRIAQRFDTTIQAIVQLNSSLTNPGLIYPGQRIKIPINPPVSAKI